MDRTKKGSKKGWGRKVLLGSSPMGWSDEILGSVSTDDELENDVNAPENIGKESKCDPRPNSLQIPGPPSQTGFSNSLQIHQTLDFCALEVCVFDFCALATI